MATFRRSIAPGATYFFTVVTQDRQPLLTAEPFYRSLKDAIRLVREKHSFEIEAFVLLPDHLHCIWTLPSGDAAYSRRWSMIKRHVSQVTRDLFKKNSNASRNSRRELGLWQRRFWEHQIRDQRDFERHTDYIHWNPVKHGYVQRVMDWPYSSFRRYVTCGVYPADWGGTELTQQDSQDFGEPA